jgi:hypothetical protein
MEIRPRKFGDCLNEWFRIMGRTWKTLLLSSLVAHVPVGIAVAVVFWATGSADNFAVFLDAEALEELTASELVDAAIPLIWTGAVWLVLQTLAGVFVYIAAGRTVASDMAGSNESWREVSRFAAARTVTGIASAVIVIVATLALLATVTVSGWALISAFGANFGTVFVVTTLALTTLVVMAWLGLSVSLGPQVIAMEDAGPFLALARSFSLVKGRWWVTFGFIALAGVIGSAASQVLSVALVPLFVIGTLVPEALSISIGASAVLQGPLLAATSAAYGLWYVDLRARREELVAAQLR